MKNLRSYPKCHPKNITAVLNNPTGHARRKKVYTPFEKGKQKVGETADLSL